MFLIDYLIFHISVPLLIRYFNIYKSSLILISTFSKLPSPSQLVSRFQLNVDLYKPFTLFHRELMRTHSNHLSDSSVNTLYVCITNVQMHTQSPLHWKEVWHRGSVSFVEAAVFCASLSFEHFAYLNTRHSDAAPTSSYHTSLPSLHARLSIPCRQIYHVSQLVYEPRHS